MRTTSESVFCFADDMVGLRPDQPFSFYTLTYGTPHWDLQCHTGEVFDQGLRALARCQAGDERFPPHRHTYVEIAIVRQGQARHRANGGDREVSRGDIIIIPPGVVHAFESFHYPHQITNCYLLTDWFYNQLRLFWHEGGVVQHLLSAALLGNGMPARQVCIVRLNEAQMAQCEEEIENITREAGRQQPSLFAYIACFQKIFNLINQTYKEQGHGEAVGVDMRVRKAIRLIESNVEKGEPFNIVALADQLQLSRTHLTRLFRSALGRPPEAYYQAYRIQYAIRLMEMNNASLGELACRLGFADQAHFSRVFKANTGLSPGRYLRSQGRGVKGKRERDH